MPASFFDRKARPASPWRLAWIALSAAVVATLTSAFLSVPSGADDRAPVGPLAPAASALLAR